MKRPDRIRKDFCISKALGFTLIELMIVVVIVAVLGSIAYPNYTAYVDRGKRSEGRAALMVLGARMERYYSDNNQYANFITVMGENTVTTENSYYTITSALGGNNQSFTLTAAPARADTFCASLTLTQALVRSKTGGTDTDANCWGK